jgi:hypothetical protein
MVATMNQADDDSDQQRLASEDVRLRLTQLSMEQNAQHLSSLQLQHDVFKRARLQLVGQSQVLETGFTATSQSLHTLHGDVHSLQRTVQPIVSQASYLSHLPQLQSDFERMVLKSLPSLISD